jgi:phosphopantothenoylcysteine decarboxylase/phosphopantothenate--cysteine ligase
MAAKSPILFAPAMNTAMYENAIVQENIEKLKNHGYLFIEPDEGRLACGTTGRGKLADVDNIIDEIINILYHKKDFKGHTVLVTAGPTIEPIDPVRYITNHSSGKMGYAIAECARNRGAHVILISGPTHLKPPRNIEFIEVNTNREMYDAVMDVFQECDIIIKSAAVAEYKPVNYSEQKIKKKDEELLLRLEKNTDILKGLGKIKGS